MTTNKYSNGKIYRLVNNVDDKEYIGSTIQTLTQRKSGHRVKAKKHADRRVYKHLNEIGFDNVEIILLENFPCSNKDELKRRERYFIETLKPDLNMAIPNRTRQEWREDNPEKVRDFAAKYREEYPEKVRDTTAKYREANREKLREKNAKYREANREKERERNAKYKEMNREKVLAQQREAYAKKKEDQASSN